MITHTNHESSRNRLTRGTRRVGSPVQRRLVVESLERRFAMAADEAVLGPIPFSQSSIDIESSSTAAIVRTIDHSSFDSDDSGNSTKPFGPVITPIDGDEFWKVDNSENIPSNDVPVIPLDNETEPETKNPEESVLPGASDGLSEEDGSDVADPGATDTGTLIDDGSDRSATDNHLVSPGLIRLEPSIKSHDSISLQTVDRWFFSDEFITGRSAQSRVRPAASSFSFEEDQALQIPDRRSSVSLTDAVYFTNDRSDGTDSHDFYLSQRPLPSLRSIARKPLPDDAGISIETFADHRSPYPQGARYSMENNRDQGSAIMTVDEPDLMDVESIENVASIAIDGSNQADGSWRNLSAIRRSTSRLALAFADATHRGIAIETCLAEPAGEHECGEENAFVGKVSRFAVLGILLSHGLSRRAMRTRIASAKGRLDEHQA